MTRDEIRHEEARCDFLTSVLFDISEDVYRHRRHVTVDELDQMQRISRDVIARRRHVNSQKVLYDIGYAFGHAMART